jgi:transposase
VLARRAPNLGQYHRIAIRRGPMKTLVSMEHAMLVAAWNMVRSGDFYPKAGADDFIARKSAKAKARAVGQL